jgi:hypothetical protein
LAQKKQPEKNKKIVWKKAIIKKIDKKNPAYKNKAKKKQI